MYLNFGCCAHKGKQRVRGKLAILRVKSLLLSPALLLAPSCESSARSPARIPQLRTIASAAAVSFLPSPPKIFCARKTLREMTKHLNDRQYT